MFTNNRRYITPDSTRDDYIALDLRLSSPYKSWHEAIEIMQGRIRGRYLEPMDKLLREDPNKNGFAAMALGCLLIEALLQFREGFPVTPSGFNYTCYTNFLHTQMNEVFTTDRVARRFYKDIRCGILHSAQTKNGSCLTYNKDYTVQCQGNGIMMVNVEGMYDLLDQYFRRYCEELMDVEQRELRVNFIKKMDDITKKWEGSDIIDNLWFAICEKQGRVIEGPNGSPYRIMVRDVDALRIDNTTITKDEIKDALYYWPKETSIKMLSKGPIILKLIQLCREVADDIILRETA